MVQQFSEKTTEKNENKIYPIVYHTDGSCEIPQYTLSKENGVSLITISEKQISDTVSYIEFSGLEQIAKTTEEGYFVVPRCSECSDYAIGFWNSHQEAFEQKFSMLNMPVFGIKTEKCCILLIADGMKYNFYVRVVLKDGMYHIYPCFEINGEQPYEAIRLRVVTLMGADADYSGMARYYRNDRLKKGEILPLKARMKENPVLEYAVNSVMIRIRCGWKPAPSTIRHQTLENEPEMHVACDFDRVSALLDELKAQGIENAEICLVGWNVKGHDGRWPQAFPVCEELGGEEKLRCLIQKAQQMGYQIVCHTNSTDQYEIADCYDADNIRKEKDGQAVIEHQAAWSGGETSQLCWQIACEQAEQLLPQVAELGFRGLHYIDVLGIVYPRRCYDEKHPVNYQQAETYAKKICRIARRAFGGISSEGAYDFLTPELDYGLYISFSDQELGICDRSIPFWQLVYHGIVLCNPYASTVNSTFKEKEQILKLLEYGGRPSYYFYSAFMGNGANWMGDADARCDTDEEMKASVAKVKEGYELYQKYAELHTAFMERHEEIAEKVYQITYSNGRKLVIDYQKQSSRLE